MALRINPPLTVLLVQKTREQRIAYRYGAHRDFMNALDEALLQQAIGIEQCIFH